MSGIKRIDNEWAVSENLMFKDDGPVYQGAKTRQFTVFSRTNRSLLARIKWLSKWRKYCLFTFDSVVFDNRCLSQIIDFMEETNTIHLSQLPNLRKFKEKQKAARQRRIEKFAKEKLTKKEICDILDSKDVERQIEPVPSTETNSVVEGVNVYAPELNT